MWNEPLYERMFLDFDENYKKSKKLRSKQKQLEIKKENKQDKSIFDLLSFKNILNDSNEQENEKIGIKQKNTKRKEMKRIKRKENEKEKERGNENENEIYLIPTQDTYEESITFQGQLQYLDNYDSEELDSDQKFALNLIKEDYEERKNAEEFLRKTEKDSIFLINEIHDPLSSSLSSSTIFFGSLPNQPVLPFSCPSRSPFLIQTDPDFKELNSKNNQNVKIPNKKNNSEPKINKIEYYHCELCKKDVDLKKTYLLNKCKNRYCIFCLKAIIQKSINLKCVSSIKCPKCSDHTLGESEIKLLLTKDEFEEYLEASLNEALGGTELICCPSCSFRFEKLQNPKNTIEKVSAIVEYDSNMKELSNKAKIHRNTWRFRCRNCGKGFCAKCKSTPYHLGFDCQSFRQLKSIEKCRYCESPITLNNIFVGKEHKLVCNSKECKKMFQQSCSKKLDCGHFCCGNKKEKTHLGCLVEGCKNKFCNKNIISKNSNQNSKEFCNICWTTALENAPCIQLNCGHVFHTHCIKHRIRSRWTGARITFNFASCPLCNTFIKKDILPNEMEPVYKLRKIVKKKAIAQLNYEGLQHDKRIQLQFSGDKFAFAMKVFSYYLCNKCRKPYFGGLQQCGIQREFNENFNEKDLICGGCSFVEGKNGKPCPIHKTKYLVWKCRFCCNIAVWFCWGTTHFCDECHKKSTILPRLPLNKLPKCVGPPKCIREHPRNGVEYCYGCYLCLKKDTQNN
ncbi:e3 ubiquitin-protein ligase mycbp2 [Anaeramoeba flamelloides]|uniref:E3 ubiquitin-protein ligase mycbp2 n=1 Tax=Anaeramoeba flamelloides TaxID=1746091 RepID=A0ABQ8YHJ0_9EUKA|nr:e3 ubiquitin-protein ligase mycbp2 [Anaeramoeba flamelloides]